MTNLKRSLLVISFVFGCIGLAAGCSSGQPGSASVAETATQSPPLAATASVTAASATEAVPATIASGSAGGQAPVEIASPLALASAYVQQNSGRPPAAAIDPCLMLPRDAAEAGARTALAELRRYSDTTGPACEYSSGSSEVSVTVTALPSGGRRVYEDSSEGYRSSRTEVAGVGDKAFIVKGLGVLYVLKGDTLLTLQLVSLKLGGDDTAAALTTMAKVALSHL